MSTVIHGVKSVPSVGVPLVFSVAGLALAFLLTGAAAQQGVVPIPELRRWEENMVKFGKQHFDQRDKGTWEGAVWYYDGERVFYQIADYTRDPSWNRAAQNSEQTYRTYVLKNNGQIPGYRIFPHGLAMDYERTGDEDSKRAAILLSKNAAYAKRGGGSGESLSRETAYCIHAYLVAETLGEPRNPNLKKAVDNALGHIDQWFVKNASENWAPFMFALTAEALIAYHDQVGPDPRILPAVKLGCDECWKRAWVQKDQSFWYRADNRSKGSPDLNLLVAPAYAWVYLQTGDTKYRDMGDRVFAGGVRGAYLAGAGKQFSQNYRWSFAYITWRTQAEHKGLGGGE